MAFTYSDYMSSAYTAAQRLDRCRLYIAELQAAAGKPDISADGRSINYAGLQNMLRDAKADLATLEADPRARTRGNRVRVVFNR